MKRKAIQLANNTLVVSLPAKWVQQNGIEKGADLEVDAKDRILVISKDAASASSGLSMKIDISGMNASLVWNYMNAIYRTGCTELEVLFSDSSIKDIKSGKTIKTMDLLSRITDKLIGMEIISQSKRSCVLKEITSLKGDEFTNVSNRIFLSLLTISKDVIEAAKSRDEETLGNLYMYSEINLNKLSDYCLRILNIRGLDDFKKSNLNYLITFLLEEVGDVYAQIARISASDPKIVLAPETVAFFGRTNELLLLAHKFFLNPKKEYYVLFHEKRNALKKDIDSLLGSRKKVNVEVLFWLKIILDKLMELNNCRATASSLL